MIWHGEDIGRSIAVEERKIEWRLLLILRHSSERVHVFKSDSYLIICFRFLKEMSSCLSEQEVDLSKEEGIHASLVVYSLQQLMMLGTHN